MKSSAALKKAAKLIDVPEKWTKGTFARTPSGRGIGWYTASARQFCAYGAVLRVGGSGVAIGRLWNVLPPAGVTAFNDAPDTTHDDVMTAFAWAIVLAEDAGD